MSKYVVTLNEEDLQMSSKVRQIEARQIHALEFKQLGLDVESAAVAAIVIKIPPI